MAYFRVIEANTKYKNATFHSIRFLVEQVSENAAVRHWLTEHMDNWVESWLLGSNSDAVREQTHNLFMGNFLMPCSFLYLFVINWII